MQEVWKKNLTFGCLSPSKSLNCCLTFIKVPPSRVCELADSSINLLNKQRRANLLVPRERTAPFVFIVFIPNDSVSRAGPNANKELVQPNVSWHVVNSFKFFCVEFQTPAQVLFCHLKLSVLSNLSVRLQLCVFCCGSLQIILKKQRHNQTQKDATYMDAFHVTLKQWCLKLPLKFTVYIFSSAK